MDRACNVGGIDRSSLYESYTGSPFPIVALNSYDSGYVAFGNRYSMTFERWLIVTTMDQQR